MSRKRTGLSLPTRPEDKDDSQINSKPASQSPLNNINEDSAERLTSLLGVLDSESKNSEHPFKFKMVKADRIIFNRANDFNTSASEIVAKKNTILHNSILYPLIVKYDLETDTYSLTAGEKRLRASYLLKEEYEQQIHNSSPDDNFISLYKKNVEPLFELGFPVSVKANISNVQDRIIMNSTNLDVTELTPSEKAKKIAEQTLLYEQLAEEEGQNKPQNLNKKIMEDFHLSERQLQKYNVINDEMVAELKEEFDKNKLSVNKGSSFAKLSHEEQKAIAELLKNNREVTNSEIELIKKENELARKKSEDLEIELSQQAKKLLEAEKNQGEELSKHQQIIQELQKAKSNYDAEKDSLKENLRKELESENPDKDRIKELENNLKQNNSNRTAIETEMKNLLEKNKSQKKEISKLREKLNKVSSPPQLTEQEKEQLKSEYELNLIKTELNKNFDLAKKALLKCKKSGNQTAVNDFLETVKSLSSEFTTQQ